MELNEAARRIVWRHGALILAFVLMGGVITAALHLRDQTTYTATSRLVLDTSDPQSSAESVAIADTARAIATSPNQVTTALRTIRVRRDPAVVAAQHVSLEALGTSGILQLSVQDPSPQVAARLANALAGTVIRTRLAATSGSVDQVASGLDARILDITNKIASIDSDVNKLIVRQATAASPTQAKSLKAQADNLVRLRDYLAQQRTVLETQRDALLGSSALRPKPAIINRASIPIHADPSHDVVHVLLGMFVGLVLGVGVAAAMEILQPSLVGAEAVARELQVPLLGELSPPPLAKDGAETRTVASRLRLAASSSHLTVVELVAADPRIDLQPIIDGIRVDGAPPAIERSSELVPVPAQGLLGQAVGTRRKAEALIVRASSPFVSGNGRATGLVLVAPMVVAKANLTRAVDLSRITGWPILGVIVLRRRLFGGRPGEPERPGRTKPPAQPRPERSPTPEGSVEP